MFERKSFQHHYEGAMEPFKIIGNVYYVGCFSASSHLIDTGDGLILIDTGYADTLHLLINSIYQLGFSPYDIKKIIHTHKHGDHTGATAALVHLTGAETYIGEKDAESAKEYFEPDVLLKDGDVVQLGNTEIRVLETPGHTIGTISLFFETAEKGKIYRVGTFGGAGANTLAKGRFDYPDCREGYRASLARLREETVDVFIGNHVWNNDTEAKAKILKETGENPFIDDELWCMFLNFCEKRLDDLIEKEEEQI
ncbi:MAG: MBL fold metallo-hydrolase [Clostridia bacterium]|nr:MBL fold metallo-hydrolase [Clostridia bacterium]